MREIDTLAIQGGGIKLITAIGALRILEQKDLMKGINKLAGSSAGAIICVLLNIGFTADEIESTVFSQTSSIVHDFFLKIPYHLLFNYGLYTGNKMIKYIQTLFTEKGFDLDITFSQLYEKTGKTLVLTGTSLNTMDTFYFNYHTMPDMKVIDALRISISIPIYFTSVEYKINDITHIMVDGGTLQNFPIYYFDIVDNTGKYILTSKDLVKEKELVMKKLKCIDCSKTLGIMYLDKDQEQNVDYFYQGFTQITNIYEYCTTLLNTFLTKIEQDNFKNPVTGAKNNFFNNIICIPMPFNVNAVNFNLPKEKKDLLIKAGEDAANKYFNSIVS